MREIIYKFAEKGMNISPEVYERILQFENPLVFTTDLILKIRAKFSKRELFYLDEEFLLGYINDVAKKNIKNKDNEDSLTLKSQKNHDTKVVSNEFTKKDTNKNTIETENKSSIKVSKKDSNQIKDFDPSKCFRNSSDVDNNYDFKVVQDTTNKSYTSGEINNLISYFANRFEKLSNILSKRAELKVPQKIKDVVGNNEFNIIGMVNDIKTTKNGHRIVDLEDDTGIINVLFHKDNQEIFNESEKLVKDEVIGLIGEKKRDLAISSKIIYPGVQRVVNKPMNFSIAFISDVHIGSLNFLDDVFSKFIKWINGDFGTDEQVKMGNTVKYLIIAGDLVDGIGIYPNQDKELAIKDIAQQYEEAARYLGDIRSDVKIILGPGNHDASRVAEPQTAIPEKYAKSLYQLNNIEFVSNPAVVNMEGFNTLIYHGRGFDDLAMTMKGMSHEKNDVLMEKMLKMRHLAPIYGERTPLASELEDHLVINETPDIFHTGHVHINRYKQYNGIHLINSGTFQTQTEFQKTHNIVPTAGLVPVLHKGDYKELNFLTEIKIMSLVENVLSVCKYVFERNLVLGKAGNVSSRENGGDIIAITPTLKSLNRLKEEDIVLTNINGDVLIGGVPSSELQMHLAIYKEREDVNGIVHTHSPYATGFSFSNFNLKRLEGFGKIEKEYIKKIPYKVPGSLELAKHASIALKDEDVLILEKHGIVTVGSTIEEAGDLAEFVEGIAKTQFISKLLKT